MPVYRGYSLLSVVKKNRIIDISLFKMATAPEPIALQNASGSCRERTGKKHQGGCRDGPCARPKGTHGTTLRMRPLFVLASNPLTRPRSSGPLSREGRGGPAAGALASRGGPCARPKGTHGGCPYRVLLGGARWETLLD